MCTGGHYEKKLLRHLFNQSRPDAHNILERPVKNESQAVEVRVKFTIQQLMDVDEKNQVVITNIWLDMKWFDYHFQWNADDYNGIKMINVKPDSVWKPDLLNYYSADEKFDGTFPTNVIVYNDSKMVYVPPAMYKSSCTIEIADFPFDFQTCSLKFGSWTYHGDFIDLRLQCNEDRFGEDENCTHGGSADLTEYRQNGEWDLVSAEIKRNIKSYECCPERYIDLTLTLQLKRLIRYYIFNLIIPCMMVSSMALLVFCLPPDAGEKISLGVTILLSLTMFLLLVANYIPQTSGAVPLLGMYFICIMIVCTLSVVFTVVVLNLHHMHSELHPVPRWVRIYINRRLGPLVFLDPPTSIVSQDESEVGMNGRIFDNFSNFEVELGGKTRSPHFKKLRKSPWKTDGTGSRLAEAGMTIRPSRSLLANILNLEDDIRSLVDPPDYNQYMSSAHSTDGGHLGGPTFSPVVNQYGGISNHVSRSTSPSRQLPRGAASVPSSAARVPPSCSTRAELNAVLLELRHITRKMKDDEAASIETREWMFAARVVDRFCFIVFTLATIIATLVILF